MLEKHTSFSPEIRGWEELGTMPIGRTLDVVRNLIEQGVPAILMPTDDSKMYHIYIPHGGGSLDGISAIGNPEDMDISGLETILRDKLAQNSGVFFCIQSYEDSTGGEVKILLNYIIKNPTLAVVQKTMPLYAGVVSQTLQ